MKNYLKFITERFDGSKFVNPILNSKDGKKLTLAWDEGRDDRVSAIITTYWKNQKKPLTPKELKKALDYLF